MLTRAEYKVEKYPGDVLPPKMPFSRFRRARNFKRTNDIYQDKNNNANPALKT